MLAFNSTKFGPPNMSLFRVIGTTDIDGKGTKHDVERQVDPFVLLDEACFPKGTKAPFGAHPHTGLVANTILYTQDSMFWDNAQNKNYGPCQKGGIFQIHAGKGIVHDEGLDPQEIQEDENEYNHVLQLWFNPGMHLGTLNQMAEYKIVQPSDIPQNLNLGNATVRVLLGKYGQLQSPAECYNAQLFLLDCQQIQDNQNQTIFSIPVNYNAWIYVLKASNTYGLEILFENQKINCQVGQIVVFPQQNQDLQITTKINVSSSNSDEQKCHFILGSGIPFNQPWFKLLGSNGAFLGNSEEYVRSKLNEYQDDPQHFGQKI